MAMILHVVGSFDPAGDVVRCVRELRKHSVYQHKLIVTRRHPFQEFMHFDEAELVAHTMPDGFADGVDAVLCHFVGWPEEWKPLDVPMAFRNLNIRYDADADRFFSEPQYNAASLEPFRLVASSHVGATDIVGEKHFRWLPDLLDIWAPELTPDFAPRKPCVSYIKHADDIDAWDLDGTRKLNLYMRPHNEVLERRKHEATVVIDNVSDGHWGLAGNESLALGLPTIVFNHKRTHAALRRHVLTHRPPLHEVFDSALLPFTNTFTLTHARECVRADNRMSPEDHDARRRDIRSWTERHWDSKDLITRYWDRFFTELLP